MLPMDCRLWKHLDGINSQMLMQVCQVEVRKGGRASKVSIYYLT